MSKLAVAGVIALLVFLSWQAMTLDHAPSSADGHISSANQWWIAHLPPDRRRRLLESVTNDGH
jgi:hypothetical protein